MLVLTLIVFRRQVPMRIRVVPGEWRALVAPVLSYAAAVAAAAIYFRVAILLVSVLSSGRQLGYFGLSFNVMAALFAIPAMLVSVAFPIFSRAARDDHARLAYAIERVFEVSLIVGAWMSLAIALGARFAIEVIGGHKFVPAADVLAIQGISVGATFVGTVWGFGLLSLATPSRDPAVQPVRARSRDRRRVDPRERRRRARRGDRHVGRRARQRGRRRVAARARSRAPAPVAARAAEGRHRDRDRRRARAAGHLRARARGHLRRPVPDSRCSPCARCPPSCSRYCPAGCAARLTRPRRAAAPAAGLGAVAAQTSRMSA